VISKAICVNVATLPVPAVTRRVPSPLMPKSALMESARTGKARTLRFATGKATWQPSSSRKARGGREHLDVAQDALRMPLVDGVHDGSADDERRDD
jgi:hypothetical protein